MELYSQDNHDTIIGNIKYILPCSIYTAVLWVVLLLLFYIIGLPLGISSFPTI